MATGVPMFAFEGVQAPPPAEASGEGVVSAELAVATMAEGPSLRDVAAGAKVPFPLVESLLESLGAGTDALVDHLVYIPDEDVRANIDKTKLDGNDLTGLQKGQLHCFWKALSKASTAGPQPSTTVTASVAAPATPSGRMFQVGAKAQVVGLKSVCRWDPRSLRCSSVAILARACRSSALCVRS